MTQEQVVAGLRAQGKNQLADMLGSMHLTPGQGVDFGALANVLLVLVGVYLLSSVFGWLQAWIMAGVTQRTVHRLRQDVDTKLGRLPLKYFDGHPRGDVLSRVTNDIDNIGQTLQQSLTQLITSLLTIIGVLALMLTISPILAVISILAVPVSIVVTVLIADAVAEAVRGAVGLDRHPERPRRGDAHRARDREGLRAPAGGDRHVRRGERASSTRRATAPSSSPGSSSRR